MKSVLVVRMVLSLFVLTTLCGAAVESRAAEKIGVVLMHGKHGTPNGPVKLLAEHLQDEGFLVSTPIMAWSKKRKYDIPYKQALAEIDTAVRKLREEGASRVVVAGHSMGGNAAMYYALQYKPDALLLLAPAHIPQSELFRKELSASVKKARDMVAAGKGEERGSFEDMELSGNSRFDISTSAAAYLSYFDPDGPANLELTAPKLPGNVPLLMVVAKRENPIIREIEDRFYPTIPGNAKQRIEVDAGHRDVTGRSRSEVTRWLRELSAR